MDVKTSFTESNFEIFHDDFEILNRTLWKFDIGKGPNNDGWGNGEKQSYTDYYEANAFVSDDGVLNVKAIEEQMANGPLQDCILARHSVLPLVVGMLVSEPNR